MTFFLIFAQKHRLWACADAENFLRRGPNSQKGPDGKFNMAKINNLAIPGGGGGGVRTPCLPISGSAHGGYSLEPPRLGGSNVYPQSML